MASYEVDKNMIVSDVIGEADAIFYDVRKDPFDLYGLYDPKNQPQFKRLPDEVATSVNEGVARLYLNTSGGRVLCVSSFGETHEDAVEKAYCGIEKISFENMYKRNDIGRSIK